MILYLNKVYYVISISNLGYNFSNSSTGRHCLFCYFCIVKQLNQKNMSKKVLILSSSPRRGGNSDMLCDEFMRGAIESGNETEKIFLRDKTIHPCTGCGVCSSKKNLVRKKTMQQRSLVRCSLPMLLLWQRRFISMP